LLLTIPFGEKLAAPIIIQSHPVVNDGKPAENSKMKKNERKNDICE